MDSFAAVLTMLSRSSMYTLFVVNQKEKFSYAMVTVTVRLCK
jgi:hypothetical protein